METRINKKISCYIHDVKNDLKTMIQAKCSIESEKNSLINFIDQINILELEQSDFSKRKRIRNNVPIYERCNAKRANGDRCTRKKKDGKDYCGTHLKSQPHGIISNEDTNETNFKNILVRTQDINGVIYYIDDFNNVYYHQDIMNNIHNPRIVSKYKYDKNTDTYEIINTT